MVGSIHGIENGIDVHDRLLPVTGAVAGTAGVDGCHETDIAVAAESHVRYHLKNASVFCSKFKTANAFFRYQY
jgi:hypothetical protein